MILLPLYLDPGTGSALFSIFFGLVATLYFVFRAQILIFLKTIFGSRSIKQSKNYHPYTIYCEGRQYASVFLPVLEEFEKRKIELLYLTGAQNDPALAAAYQYVKPEYIGEGNKSFTRLNFLSAGIVLSTTPGLDVYQWKRSKAVGHYSHMLHGVVFSAKYEMFGIDYYDSILLSAGTYEIPMIRELEKLRSLPEKTLYPVGCTFLDMFEEKIKSRSSNLQNKIADNEITVLLAPTWGELGFFTKYGEKLIDPLAATGLHIIARPHPQAKKVDVPVLKSLQEKYKNAANVEWDYDSDILDLLVKSDIMISDFSSIIFDFMFLFDKPVIYINEEIDLRPYDLYYLKGEQWLTKTLRETCVELKENMFGEIGSLIHKSLQDERMKTARLKAKDETWQYRGESGKRIADFMIDTVKAMASAD